MIETGGGGRDNEQYAVGTGSSATGDTYSFGGDAATDRALGGLRSGTLVPTFGASFTNNTGSTVTSLTIAYTGEQWRLGTVSRTDQLNFEYSTNASDLVTGTWTGVSQLNFVTPSTATAGAKDGNAVGNKTSLSHTITGLSIPNGTTFWIRFTDTDASGADDGLAVDDFSLTPNISNDPTLSINDVSASEGNAGTTNFTFTVSLSAPAGAGGVTFDIATADNTAINPGDYTSSSLTGQTIPAGSSTYSFTVLVNGDLSVEPNETFFVNVTNVTGAIVVDGQGQGTIETDDVSIVSIHDVQGNGATTPIPGASATIEGIVTRTFTGSTGLNGFYVQEEDADVDADPATSEGIFIFDPAGLFMGTAGDKVQVSGTVAEFVSSSGGVSSSLTQLNNLTSVTTLTSGNALPTTVMVKFPVSNVSDLERFEGMLVEVSATEGNLVVTDNFQLGRFGQVVLSVAGTSNAAGTDARLDQYTQFNAPSVQGYAAYLSEVAKRKIILDDGSSQSNPSVILFGRNGQPLSASNTLRAGDELSAVTAVLDERFEGYRLQTNTGVNFLATNPRPATPPNVGGTLQVGSFNLLNYFNGTGTGSGFPTSRGADNLTEFNRQRDKTIKAIVDSGLDIVVFNEIENDGYDANSAIQDIVNGANAATAPDTYSFINPGTSTATDEITVAMIYKPSRVIPVGNAAVIPNGFGNGAFDIVGRKPLAQTFEEIATKARFTVVGNHWKSKGSSSGGAGDADANDGQGQSNGTRTRQAQDLASWLSTMPTGSTDPDYLILGDLNAYAQEDPLTTLKNASYTNLIPDATYSYVFGSFFGALDHALGSSSLTSQVAGATKWHINADEPIVLDYNTENKSTDQRNSLYNVDPFRTSDHDPVIVGLSLTPIEPLSLSFMVTDVPCNGGTTGSINLTVSGGEGPFTYAWSNGTSTEDISGLPADSYSVTVTDGRGSTATSQVTVSEPSPIVVTPGPNRSVALGYGGPTSNCTDISATANGGTGTLSFAWSNNAGNTPTVTVCPTATTTYTVTVTDENGCQATAQVTVTVQDVRCGNKNQNVQICYYGVTQCVSEKVARNYLRIGATLGACNAGNTRISYEPQTSEISLQLTLKAYPNPVQDAVKVEVLNPVVGEATFQVLDMAGRTLQTRKEVLIEGPKEVEFSLGTLPSGIYLIRAVDALGKQGVVRINKQ
jgi:predicted extracellular nuclease